MLGWLVLELSSSSRIKLSFAVEVGCCNWCSKVINLTEISGVEILAPSRSIHSLSTRLTKHYENNTMNPHHRSWTFIPHNLFTYKTYIFHNQNYITYNNYKTATKCISLHKHIL